MGGWVVALYNIIPYHIHSCTLKQMFAVYIIAQRLTVYRRLHIIVFLMDSVLIPVGFLMDSSWILYGCLVDS